MRSNRAHISLSAAPGSRIQVKHTSAPISLALHWDHSLPGGQIIGDPDEGLAHVEPNDSTSDFWWPKESNTCRAVENADASHQKYNPHVVHISNLFPIPEGPMRSSDTFGDLHISRNEARDFALCVTGHVPIQ